MKRQFLRRETLVAYGFMLPALLFFATFMIYPLLKSLQMSLHDWSIMPDQPNVFVGLANYSRAFDDPIFWVALRNTVIYTIVTVPGQMVLAMLVALLLNHIHRGRVFFRVIYYLPVITAWVIVSLLFRYLFQSPGGLVNYLITDVVPIVSAPIPWLRNAKTAMIPVMGLGIWKGIGWSMIIFLAALQAIPGEFYEVAAIDGASRWNRFWSITLPLMRPTIVFVLVMLVIGGFNVFISVYLITAGGPMGQTEVLLSYMYRQAFDFLEFGYGAALSYMLAFLILVLSVLQIRFLRKPVEYH